MLGELDFPSVDDQFPRATDDPGWKTFSDRLEGTRRSTWATGICLAIVSFIAVIMEITLLVISFLGCAAGSTTLLLIVVGHYQKKYYMHVHVYVIIVNTPLFVLYGI